jgi:hypothetical protein
VKRLTRRLLVLAGVFVAAPLLLEGALRIWKPWPLDPPLYPGDREPDAASDGPGVLDDAIGWKFAPSAQVDDPSPDFHIVYRCNADGFRATKARELAADAPCAVFVGDSFTFGVGVEEPQTFVELFAGAHAGTRVVNLGMAGFGVDQMLCALREYGLREKPRLVVALFVDDDLTRCTTSYRYRNGWVAKPTFALEKGKLAPRTVANSPGAVRRWLEQNVYLCELRRRVLNKLGNERGFGERFQLSRALFAEMDRECRAIGARLVVVRLPQRGAWRPAPAFESAFAALDVPYLDLGTRAVPDSRSLFFAKDPHIDADGHRFVADELARFLAQSGL